MLDKRLMKTRKQITEFTTQLLELTQSTCIEYAKEQGQNAKTKKPSVFPTTSLTADPNAGTLEKIGPPVSMATDCHHSDCSLLLLKEVFQLVRRGKL